MGGAASVLPLVRPRDVYRDDVTY